jgi:peptide/nickel transport system substrate-binding protein
LLEKGQVEVDQAKRAEIYKEAQKLIVQDAPYIFLHINDQYEAMSPNVKGYTTTPTGSFIAFREAWLGK